ncbi:hypothetical protein B7939_01175 [Eggerthia catenaformis]|nr:hypothetical protein B7939_01175 [Eggerthia catenaformis]
MNLESCFKNVDITLDEVKYKKIYEQVKDINEINILDNIEYEVDHDKKAIFLTIKRSLKVSPEALMDLSVKFIVLLEFTEKAYSDYDWDNINVKEEFYENGQFITGPVIARISSLISVITGIDGSIPIVLMPSLGKKKD